MVLSNVDAEDHLARKFTCKALNSFLPVPFPIAMRNAHCDPSGSLSTGLARRLPWHRLDSMAFASQRNRVRDWVVEVHARMEASLMLLGPRTHLLCTHCQKVKAKETFEDSQADRVFKEHYYSPQRMCISCGIDYLEVEYAHEKHIRVQNKRQFACADCHQAFPLDKRVYLHERGTRDNAVFEDLLGDYAVQNLCQPCADENGWTYRRASTVKGYWRTGKITIEWGKNDDDDEGESESESEDESQREGEDS